MQVGPDVWSLGAYLFRGEPEQQEVKVCSGEEAREAGGGAGLGRLKSPSSLFPGVSMKGSTLEEWASG